MDSEQLIKQVFSMMETEWKDSGLDVRSEALLEAVAEHLNECELCYHYFNSMGIEGNTLLEVVTELMTMGTHLDEIFV